MKKKSIHSLVHFALTPNTLFLTYLCTAHWQCLSGNNSLSGIAHNARDIFASNSQPPYSPMANTSCTFAQ